MIENDYTDRLFTPANIKVRYEFISGFGFNELFTTIIVAGVFSALIFLINLLFIKDNYNAVLVVSVFGVAVGMAVRKNDMNQSITDIVKLAIKFELQQQKYKYTYHKRYDRK